MKNKKTIGSVVFDTINILIMWFIIIIMLYPFIYTLSVSVSKPAYVEAGWVWLLPIGFNINAYKMFFSASNVLRGYWNTIVYSVSGTFLSLFLMAITAYPLSRKDFYGRKAIMLIFIFTMYFYAGIIPGYLLVKFLGMMNTIWAIIVPGAIGTWYVIIFRTFFMEIPVEMSESAYIDGAGDWRILFQIILPLSKPVLATIGLFLIVGQWNSFAAPYFYLSDKDKYPIQLVLRKLLDPGSLHGREFQRKDIVEVPLKSLRSAAIVFTTLPVILVYPFLQKYFVKGVMIGSIKG